MRGVDGAFTFAAQLGHDTAARQIVRQFCEFRTAILGFATHLQQLFHITHWQHRKRFQDRGATFVRSGTALEDAGEQAFGLDLSITARIGFSECP